MTKPTIMDVADLAKDQGSPVKKSKPPTKREIALRAGDTAMILVEIYLRDSGGLERGFTFQRFEKRLWQAIRRELKAAYADGVRAGKASRPRPQRTR